MMLVAHAAALVLSGAPAAVWMPKLKRVRESVKSAAPARMRGSSALGVDLCHARRLLPGLLLPYHANRRAKTRVARPKNTAVKAARTIRSMMAVSSGPPIIAISSASTA